MEIVTDLLKILLPSALVLYAMYLTISTFLKKQFEEKQLALHQKQIEIILPIRLQAYERMCLFLERISPNNLIVRTNGTAANVIEFQQILMHEIREEFNHNLSQQVYMSHESWERIRGAQQEIMTLINQAAVEVAPDAAPLELSKKIFEKLIQENRNPTVIALKQIKEEIQKEFL